MARRCCSAHATWYETRWLRHLCQSFPVTRNVSWKHNTSSSGCTRSCAREAYRSVRHHSCRPNWDVYSKQWPFHLIEQCPEDAEYDFGSLPVTILSDTLIEPGGFLQWEEFDIESRRTICPKNVASPSFEKMRQFGNKLGSRIGLIHEWVIIFVRYASVTNIDQMAESLRPRGREDWRTQSPRFKTTTYQPGRW